MVTQHRPGKEHGNADGLSRIPVREDDCNCYEAGAKLEDLPCYPCKKCEKLHYQWQRFEEDVDDVIPLSLRSLSFEDDLEDSGV